MLSALVISPNPKVPGGVSTFVECMKRHLKQTEAESLFVGSNGERGSESVPSILWRLLFAPTVLAWRVIRKKYDIVHINPSFDTKALVRDGLLLLKLRSIFYRHAFVYFHGWDFAVQKRIMSLPPARALLAWLLNGAALIAVLGDEFRDGLISLGVDKDRIVVTRTMFEGAGYREIEKETPAPHRSYILFMSRFDREKGGRELLQAFAALNRPDIDLVMAGDGEEKSYWQNEAILLNIVDRVKFPGYINGPDKWRLLRDCTIFALPTYYRSEGMPVVVLEAMGAGKPLLVGTAGAMRSIVTRENGVILDEITPDTVEAGLRKLLDDPAFAAAAGKRNTELAWQKFEAAKVTAEIEQFYIRVAAC